MRFLLFVYIGIFAAAALQRVREDIRFEVPRWKATLSTVVARRSSRSWFRPWPVPWLVIYHAAVAAAAVYLLTEVA